MANPQVRVAAGPRGTVFVDITDDDRLRIIRELPVSDGWKELFRMREANEPWERIMDRAAKLRPSITDEELRRGLASVYTEMESRISACATYRARLGVGRPAGV